MEETLRILVVDDNELDRIAVRRALRKAGIKTKFSEAINAKEAIATLQNTTFDCVFLDYRLPDQDGLSLIRELHLMGIQVPLIVLTGQGDEQLAVEIMKAGASDYLAKSRVSPEVLSKTIHHAIRLHRAERQVALANTELRESNELLRRKNEELNQQQQQIQRQNLELQEAARLKSQFLATISHELRTPMNAIIGFSQILLRQYSDSLSLQQINIVQRIFNNSQNLLTLVNEVLDFSKLEVDQLKLNLQEFDLSELVILTTEELRSLALQKKLNLQLQIDIKNSLVVNDPKCLRRILTNLISNAIKFTDSGEIWVKVWELNADRLAIAVKDTGIGIVHNNLDMIFEAFRQVDQSTTRKHSGTGLGLAITNSLVKMMQGKITVESNLGEGSIFQVEIPRQVENEL